MDSRAIIWFVLSCWGLCVEELSDFGFWCYLLHRNCPITFFFSNPHHLFLSLLFLPFCLFDIAYAKEKESGIADFGGRAWGLFSQTIPFCLANFDPILDAFRSGKSIFFKHNMAVYRVFFSLGISIRRFDDVWRYGYRGGLLFSRVWTAVNLHGSYIL